jgi:hypothetical protein
MQIGCLVLSYTGIVNLINIVSKLVWICDLKTVALFWYRERTYKFEYRRQP